jgi:hypothetical protein
LIAGIEISLNAISFMVASTRIRLKIRKESHSPSSKRSFEKRLEKYRKKDSSTPVMHEKEKDEHCRKDVLQRHLGVKS